MSFVCLLGLLPRAYTLGSLFQSSMLDMDVAAYVHSTILSMWHFRWVVGGCNGTRQPKS